MHDPTGDRHQDNQSLGFWRTSIYFNSTAGQAVRLQCAGVKDVTHGNPVLVHIKPEPARYIAGPDPQRIQLEMPRSVGAGLYEVTLEDEVSRTMHSYLLPFGTPEEHQ